MRRDALLALVAALLVPAPAAAALEPGNHRVLLQHDGRPRAYIVHVLPAARCGASSSASGCLSRDSSAQESP
jgi:hypothetical protein